MRAIRQLAMVSVSVVSLAVPAYAQQAQTVPDASRSASASDLEIIVTARRRDEDLQDVPLVVNAVTSDTINKLNIRDFREITNVVPGLSLVPNANGIGSSSSMRGVNHDVNVSGDNGTIQYYLNDSPVGSDFVLQAMYDIGQIEVLRGPQGTLRGRATPSGSITITTRKPDLFNPGGYIGGTLGSADTKNFQGAINVPIVEGKLGVRIAGLSDENRGDRVSSVNSDIKPYRQTRSIRASALAEPTDFLTLGFIYQALQSKARAFDQVQSFNALDPSFTPTAGAPDYGTITPSDRLSTSSYPRTMAQHIKYFGWDAGLSFAGQKLIYTGAHTSTRYDPFTVVDIANFFPSLVVGQTTHTKTSGTTHEIRLQNDERVLGMFDYVAGYFHLTGRPETSLTTDTVLRFYGQIAPGVTFPLPIPPSVNHTNIYLPKGNGSEESFFGNLTVHLGESTEVSGGLRHIRYVNDSAGLYIGCTREVYPACTQAAGSENDFKSSTTIYNATVRHRFTDDLMVYASTGSSWRPQVQAIGDFTTAPYTPNELAHLYLDSETSKSYEIGLKSDWLDKKILFNVTYYHQKFKNYPFRAAGSGVYYININSQGAQERGQFNFISAVPVTVNGVEGEVAFNPSERFSITSTFNWSQSKIGNALLACTDALINATGAVGQDGIADTVAPTLAQMQQAYGAERLAQCPGGGQSATFQPEWSGSVRAEYNHPINDRISGFARGLLAWKGKSENDPNNPYDDVGAYGLLNLFGGIRSADGAWEISAYAKNIANVTKIVSRNATPYSTSPTDVFLGAPTFAVPVGVASTTLTSAYTGLTVTPPREFGVTARFAFGSR